MKTREQLLQEELERISDLVDDLGLTYKVKLEGTTGQRICTLANALQRRAEDSGWRPA